MTRNQALSVAEDAIVSALSAVGEIVPATVRDLMIAASNWRWWRRLRTLDQPAIVNAPDEALINHTAS
jgi:hypothetical protein